MRIALHGCAAALAVAAGFLLFPVTFLERAFIGWGAAFVAAAAVLWVLALVSVIRRHGFGRAPHAVDVVLVVALTAVVVGFRAPGFNIMFDEVVIASVAQSLSEDGRAGYVDEARIENDAFRIVSVVPDKRPLMYPSLVALVHAVTGYRLSNPFWVNIFLTFVCLALLVAVGRRLSGSRVGGLFAAGLFASLPVFSESATGGGLAVLNVVLLLAAMWCALRWIEDGTGENLAFLVYTVVLLAHVRYESALFVAAAAVLAVVGWLRRRRLVLPWSILPAPLLLLPLAWNSRIQAAAGHLQNERDGVVPDAVFGLSNLPENVAHAVRFLFDLGTTIPNSPVLSVLGCVAAVVLVIRGVRRREPGVPVSGPLLVVLGFAAVVAVNAVLLLLYFWAHWDDVVVGRLTLPLMTVFALAAPMWLSGVLRRRGAAVALGAVLAAYIAAYTVPANAGGTNLAGYRERAEIRAMLEVLNDVKAGDRAHEPLWPGAGCDVITTSPQAAMLLGFPSYSFEGLEGDRTAFHASLAARRPILVFEVGRRFPAESVNVILSTHLLPRGTPLVPLAEFPLVDDCFLRVGRVAPDA